MCDETQKLDQLVASIATRNTTKRWGIGLASQYLNDIASCLSGGACPTKVFGLASAGEWNAAIKAAGRTLVYSDDRMDLRVKARTSAVPKNTLMVFDGIVTATSKDRDGDILETAGADLDKKAPLLWQHLAMHPVGKLLRELDTRTSRRLPAKFAIIDNELGRDAAELVEFGALRLSHGFRPLEYEPLGEKESGFRIKKFEIMEVSLVSVPSNPDAVIEAYDKEKLHHPAVKAWAKTKYDSRRKTLNIPVELDIQLSNASKQTLAVLKETSAATQPPTETPVTLERALAAAIKANEVERWATVFNAHNDQLKAAASEAEQNKLLQELQL